MNKPKKIDCYCHLYSRKGMCVAHTLKERRDEILNSKFLWKRIFGLSKEDKAQIKLLEKYIYKTEKTDKSPAKKKGAPM